MWVMSSQCLDYFPMERVGAERITIGLTYCHISEYASLTVLFLYNGVQQRLALKLPLTVNKFFEPTEMNSESFFGRWKNLSGYVF